MAEFSARMSIRTIIGCALLAALIGNAALSGVAGSPIRELALVTALMLGVMAAAGAIAVTAGRLHSGGRTAAYPGAVEHWHRNGVLHRENGPALTFRNGAEGYYRDGVPHREDGPALTFGAGVERVRRRGESPHEDRVSLAAIDGVEAYFRNGLLHRKGGPALTFSNGWEFWYHDGELVPHVGELPPAISCEALGWLRARLDELEHEGDHRIGLHREAHEDCAACAYVARL